MRFAHVAILLAFVALCQVGCDRSQEPPTNEQQVKRNDEGNAWRRLLSGLDTATTDAQRVSMLEKFIAANPDHPDVADAKRRLERIHQISALKAVESEAFDGAAKLAVFFLVSETQSLRPQAKTELDEPVTLPTLEGPETFQRAALATPTRLRGAVHYMLSRNHPDGLDRPCDVACLNAALNNMLRPWVGGKLFVEPGAIDKDVLGALIEKAWIAPDHAVVGTTAQQFYTFYRPTVHAFVNVRRAVSEGDHAGAVAKLHELPDDKAIGRFYVQWTQENQIAERAGLDDAKSARNIASWWIRREADGSAEVLDQFFARLLRDYDPSYTAP